MMMTFQRDIACEYDYGYQMRYERDQNHQKTPNRLVGWVLGICKLKYLPVFHEIRSTKKNFPMATSQLRKPKKCNELWEHSVEHTFIKQFVNGDLPHDKFRDYIIQDKIFCESFRGFVCQVLADCPKAEDFEVFHKLVADLQGYGHEAELFKELFQMLNITHADLRAHPTTEAFGNFLWKVGSTGTLEDKLLVLFAIEATYMDWADRALANKTLPSDETYAKWLHIHTSTNLGPLVTWLRKTLDELLGSNGERILAHHQKLFERTLQYEVMFWDTAFIPGSSVFSGEFGVTHTIPAHNRFSSGLNR